MITPNVRSGLPEHAFIAGNLVAARPAGQRELCTGGDLSCFLHGVKVSAVIVCSARAGKIVRAVRAAALFVRLLTLHPLPDLITTSSPNPR
jgi:hypothetical protein